MLVSIVKNAPVFAGNAILAGWPAWRGDGVLELAKIRRDARDDGVGGRPVSATKGVLVDGKIRGKAHR
jgi:hypothetical protein